MTWDVWSYYTSLRIPSAPDAVYAPPEDLHVKSRVRHLCGDAYGGRTMARRAAGFREAVRSARVDSLLHTLGLPPGQADHYAKSLTSAHPHLDDIVTYS